MYAADAVPQDQTKRGRIDGSCRCIHKERKHHIMTDKTEAPELLPCPFCKGGETRIEPCGQTWRGQGYSDPQFYRLTHHGKLPEGDGFETCHILFRARTIHDIVSIWNTRSDLSDAKDKRVAELEQLVATLEANLADADVLTSAAFADGASNNVRLAETSHRIAELEAKLNWVLVERDKTFALMLDRAQTAEAKLATAADGLRECEEEIDGYIRNEYPHDHPVQERYRQRDFTANPARATLAELKGTDQ